MPPQKDLAAALLQEHAVRAEALERARREHERTGRPLWAVITESGLCSEELLFRVLRRWGGANVVGEERLRGLLVPAELRGILPREMASELGVLPLERSKDGRRVALAMVDPMADFVALQTALSRSGVAEIHRFLIHGAVLRRSLLSVYAEPARSAPSDRATLRIEEEVPLSDRPTGMVTLPGPGTPLLAGQSTQVMAKPPRPQNASKSATAAPSSWGISIFGRNRRNDEKTERLPGRGEQVQRVRSRSHKGVDPRPDHDGKLLSPPVQAFPPRSVVTVPLQPVAPAQEADRPSTVQIDPQLAAEIERMAEQGPTLEPPVTVPPPPKGPPPIETAAPALPTLDSESGPNPIVPALPSSRSSPLSPEPVTQITRVPRPLPGEATMVGWPMPPSTITPTSQVAPESITEDTPVDSLLLNRPGDARIDPVDTLRLPANRGPALPSPASALTPDRASFAAAQYLTQVLLHTVEALVRELESRLLHPGEPGALQVSQLSRRVARHVGLFQRGAEEIGLLGLIYGMERLRLEDDGPLPKDLDQELGWQGQDGAGLSACLRDLQGVLSGMDQEAAQSSQPILPLGQDIVRTVATALKLLREGMDPSALPARLRERTSGEVTEAVLQVLLSDHAPHQQAEAPAALPAALTSDPEIEVLEVPEIDLSDEGLETYHVEEKGP